jgi:hypothetical protein
MIRDLGPPALTRAVDEKNHLEPCAKRGAVRVLEYRVPSRGPVAYLNRTFGSPPSQIVAVCIDSSGRILHTSMIQF